jgi:hypothetical protein
MDAQVAKLAGLIEHAELAQQTVEDAGVKLDASAIKIEAAANAARKSINEATAALDGRIARAVQQAIEAELKNLPDDLRAAMADSLSGPAESIKNGSYALNHAISRLGWRQAAVAASIAFAMVLGCVLVWWWLVPSSSKLQQLRDEHAQLVADNERLSKYRVQTCGPQALPCVRVDLGNRFEGGYYILKQGR